MSLLDTVRRLAESRPCHCPGCGAWLYANGEHKPDCPWLAMPQIVVALEAAGRIAVAGPCDGRTTHVVVHVDIEDWDRLVKAVAAG